MDVGHGAEGRAPTPHRDAIRRHREEGREAAEAYSGALLGVFLQYGFLALLGIGMAVRAHQDGHPWFGTVLLFGGWVLVVSWFFVRELRYGRRRRALRELMRERRKARRAARKRST